MTLLLYKSGHATAWLTNESTASSYGIPVLRVRCKRGATDRVQDYGPADVLPSGWTAAQLVRECLAGQCRDAVPVPDDLREWVKSFLVYPGSTET